MYTSTRLPACLAFLATLALGGSAVYALAPYTIVAITGQDVSGADPGVTFVDFHSPGQSAYPFVPLINAHGNIAFMAHLTGPGVTASNDLGLWSTALTSNDTVNGRTLHTVVRTGTHPPGTAQGVTYKLVGSPAFCDDGRSSFLSSIEGTGIVSGVNDFGIWAQSTGIFGSLALRALLGAQAPDMPAGVTFEDFFSFPFNAHCQMGLSATVMGGGIGGNNRSALWADVGGTLTKVAQAGDAPPGLPNVRWSNFLTYPAVNGNGQIAFFNYLATPAGAPDSQSLWFGAPGSLSMIARTGMQAPGLDNGVVFTRLLPAGVQQPIVINDAGQYAFVAEFAGPGVTAGVDDQGIWSNRDGTLKLIVRRGETAFIGYLPVPAMNSKGRIAVLVYDQSFSNPGIWTDASARREDAGASSFLRLVARAGDPVPGAANRTFSNFEGYPSVNGDGNVSFMAITQFGSGNNYDRRIFMTDLHNDLLQVAQTDEDFFVPGNPGHTTVITDLQMVESDAGGQEGLPRSLSETGQIGYYAKMLTGEEAILVTIGNDSDGDGVNDHFDNCPDIANPNQADADDDGFGDACETCPNDANKTAPGICGCGIAETDSDGDGTFDCIDGCPSDLAKITPGKCGCGVAETDSDGDVVPDCHDNCPQLINSDQADADGDGVGDVCDNAPNDFNPDQADSDGDGIPDVIDLVADGGSPVPLPSAGCGTCGAGTAGLAPLLLAMCGALRYGRARHPRP
jgi:hypothetical protein